MGVAGFHAMPADATMPGQEKIEWVKAGLLVQWATTEMDPSRRANAWFCSVGGERLSSEYVGHSRAREKAQENFLKLKHEENQIHKSSHSWCALTTFDNMDLGLPARLFQAAVPTQRPTVSTPASCNSDNAVLNPAPSKNP